MATLYHYPLCPFSRKIRLLLRERNVDPDLITEAFWQKRREQRYAAGDKYNAPHTVGDKEKAMDVDRCFEVPEKYAPPS